MDYAGLALRASEMLAEYGQAVTITRHSAGAYNFADSSVTDTVSTTVTTGVVLPVTKGGRGLLRYGLGDEQGTDILASDQELLLPGSIAAPSINDTVLIGALNYSIISISPLNPGGTVLVYDCVIRGVPE